MATTDVNFTAKQIGAPTVTTGSIAPSSPATNDIWNDTSSGSTVAKYWNGTAWETLGLANINYVDGQISGVVTSINGKNKTHYSSTQPGLTGNTVDDTWFDTANGYKIYSWSGSAWVAGAFGTQAIANAAITTAKIADLAVGSAQIGNLGGGNCSVSNRLGTKGTCHPSRATP